MKFKDLPATARFRWQGRCWTRDGPLSATADDGSRRVIPRWAEVEPLAEGAPTAAGEPRPLPDRETLHRALEGYEAQVARIIGGIANHLPEEEMARLRQALEAAGRELRQRLCIGS